MARFILGKVIQMLLALLATSFLVFAALYVIGEPTALFDPLIREDPERLAALKAQLGLDQPLYVQYGLFIERLLHGDLGTSWVYQEPALTLILARLPATLELVFFAILLAVLIGYPAGLMAGLREGKASGLFIERLAILGYSVPTFWIGLVLIYLFGVWFDLLPTLGRGDTIRLFDAEWSGLTPDGFKHLILPGVTLALYEIGLVTRLTVTMTRETLPKPFILFARAKGLPRTHIIRDHVVRHTATPLVTVLAVETGALIAGSVVTESVFGWPGVGKLLVESVAALDRPVIVAFILMTAVLFLILNFTADILRSLLDPTQQRGQVRAI